MAHSIVRTLLASGAATALIAIPTACSFSIGTSHSHSVSKAEVARQITAKMTDAAGNKPESVTCPSDLPAEVGAELNCEMKIKDRTFNVNVTVTSVEGSDVKFDMVETVDKNQVANIISDKLFQRVGARPDSVTCPDNLKGVEGAKLRCRLTDGSKTYGISVIVTSVDAGDVNFDFKVDDHPEWAHRGIGCPAANFAYPMWMVAGAPSALGCSGLAGRLLAFDVGQGSG